MIVSIMQTTHESGIHRCVNRDRVSPRLPTSRIRLDMGYVVSAVGFFAARRQSRDRMERTAAPKNAYW